MLIIIFNATGFYYIWSAALAFKSIHSANRVIEIITNRLIAMQFRFELKFEHLPPFH